MALFNITTKAEFEEKVLHSDKLVLVDFWANWCAPCRAMAPSLEAIADEYDSTIDIVKVDIEASPEAQALSGDYDVRSIPNMPIFQGGKEIDRIIGLVPKVQLLEMLTKLTK